MALPGNPRGSTFRCGFTGSGGGRRRAIGVVAALSRYPRATTPMVRRWVAKGGPGGRCSGKPRELRASPAHRRVPLPLGNAIPAAKSLKVGPAPPYIRRDARLHNSSQTIASPVANHRFSSVEYLAELLSSPAGAVMTLPFEKPHREDIKKRRFRESCGNGIRLTCYA